MNFEGVLKNLDNYDHVFIDHIMEINKTNLLSAISELLFEDFPTRISPHIILPIIKKRHKILKNELDRRGMRYESTDKEKNLQDEFFDKMPEIKLDDKMEKIYYQFFNIFFLSRHYKNKLLIDYPDFQRIITNKKIIVQDNFPKLAVFQKLNKIIDKKKLLALTKEN